MELDKSTLTDEQIRAHTFVLLGEWENAKAQAEAAKNAELTARAAVVEWAGDAEIAKGTENIPLNAGYKLKIVKGINYNVNKETARLQLSELAKLDNGEGAIIADRIMSWSPKLSISEYGKLKPEYKVLIDRCISTTVATPTIEIVAPSTKNAGTVAKEGFKL